jgi:hypothetical protein
VMKMIHGACFPFILALTLVIAVGNTTPVLSQDTQSDCYVAMDRWEQLVQELEDQLSGYESVRRTPVTQIIQGPLVDRRVNATIAEQVSHAIKVKEKLLDQKRTECRKVLNLENQAFHAMEACLESNRGSEKHKIKRLKSKRKKMIKKARITIAEVREVEGKTFYPQYVDSWRNQSNFYGRGRNDYWRAYRQMYRQYYGR